MKKPFYFLFALFVFVSCNKPYNDNTFTDVTLYYYGYSGMGYTYEVPVRFFINKKVEAFFILYSIDKDLKEGVYNYNDVFVPNLGMWDYGNIVFTNFTFFKGKCKWKDNIITDGFVTVERNGNNYTFIIDVTDNTGAIHTGKYQGKVKKENFEIQSKIGGVFALASVENRIGDPWAGPVGLPSSYSGGNTWVQVEAGEKNDGYMVNMLYLHPDKNDPTGTYYVNPNANGYYREGEIVYQNLCSYNISQTNTRQLLSGSITITRVDKPWKFRIDVNVTDEDGGHIQGCFDGVDMWLSGY